MTGPGRNHTQLHLTNLWILLQKQAVGRIKIKKRKLYANQTPQPMRFQFLLSFRSEWTIKRSHSVGRAIGCLLSIVWIKAIEPYSNGNRNSKRKQMIEIKKIKKNKKRGEEVPVGQFNEVFRSLQMWTLDYRKENWRKRAWESKVRSERMVRVSNISESRDEAGLIMKRLKRP